MIEIYSPRQIGLTETYIRMCDPEEVKNVIGICSREKSYHRQNRNGYTKDREMRSVGHIPSSVYYHPKLRHIFFNPDPKEGARLKEEFFRTYNKFATTDKI